MSPLNGMNLKRFSISAFGILWLTSFSAHAETYQLDPTHSTMGFKVKHLVISTVTGRFNKFEGGADFDSKTGKFENLKVKIEAESIDTNEAKRDEHLRGKDFFDAKSFPIIEFKNTKFTYSGKKPTKVTGDLTIHGITKPVTLKFDFNGTVKDPWGNQRAAFSAKGTINRKDFGLNWNKTLDAGGVLIAEKVDLEIEGEALAK